MGFFKKILATLFLFSLLLSFVPSAQAAVPMVTLTGPWSEQHYDDNPTAYDGKIWGGWLLRAVNVERTIWYRDRTEFQYISPMLDDPNEWVPTSNQVAVEILKFPYYGARSYPISIRDCGGTAPGAGNCHPHTFKPTAPENQWAIKIAKTHWKYHYNMDYYNGILGPYYVFFAGQQMGYKYEIKYREKQAPTANFSYSPSTIYNTTTVSFTDTSTDPDNQTMTYQWAYRTPGSTTWTNFSTLKNPTRNLNIKGSWGIRLTVRDADGLTSTVSKNLVVSNRAPVASFTHSPTTIYNNTNVSFTNASTDPDGDTLTYQWAYQAPGSTTWTDFSTVKDPSRIFNIKGTWNIRLTASDGTASHSVTRALTVSNRAPVASFTHSPTTVYNNTNVSFTNSSTDADGDTLTYQWAYQAPGSTTWTNFSTVKDPNRIFNIKGTWNIRLTVSDGTASHSVTRVLTVSNRAPVASFTHSPATIYNNTNVSFTNGSTDPDGDTLTYQWAYQEPGSTTWTNFSTAKDPSRVFNIKGTWSIRLTVSDGTASHSVTRTLTVSNRAPVASFTHSPSTIYNDTNVTFTNSSTDPDGDTLTYQWAYQAPGSTTWTNFSQVKDPNRVFNIKGAWNIRLTVSDGTASHSVTRALTVSNRAPVASFMHSPTTIYNDTTVSFTNGSTDADGDTLTYQWAYQEPGSTTWTSFSTVENPSRTFNIKGTWNIRLTVFDGTDSHTATGTLTVSNRAPVASFTHSPTTIYNNTTVSFTNGSTDADGDTLTYQWAYQAPGSTTWTSFSTAKDPSRVFNIKGTWSIRLTVSDGTASHSVTRTLTVSNRAPVASFTHSPATIYNNTNVSFTNGSTDPDGDTLTYQWAYQEPGSTTWTNFSTVKDPSRIFNIKGTWNIRLTVSDGTASHSVTRVLTVLNRAPVANFTYSPTTIYKDTTVTFNDSSTDPDGDTLTYQWAYQEPGSTSWINFSTVKNPSRVLDIKGTWGIRLTVTDTSGATASVIKNPVVVNRAPEVTVSYTPNEPYEGDTVNVCVVPTDKDNDLLNVQLFVSKDGAAEQLVMNKSNVVSNTQQCYSFVSEVGRYDLRVTVSDGAEITTSSTWFYSKTLILNGYVKHTEFWEDKHQSLGNRENQFYSGEKFILEADTSQYPIEYVKSTLIASRENGTPVSSPSTLAKSTSTFYIGELYDPTFLDYPTNLKVGPAAFEFEVKYTNGVIKKATVPIEIIADSFEVFKLHRSY
ncbi:hypothetical protein D1B31_17850 [Neobacillus notoginsengisoli]|uniref:PKD domain-containing protein n=1 Tax=Neobacillus notoginsengisoli TaxID=1578198 RepID=A0A417YQF5_9BACI|nr:PKD domain-containing protein [Neobacillus notoginsengisoli]RHW35956.1 hypothetical protein D1B31_17850 [Neobacillus notoginsengisoli]